MYEWIDINLPSGNDSNMRMLGNGRDLDFMSLIELLVSHIQIIHDTNSRTKIQDVLLAVWMYWVILNSLVHHHQIIVVCAENARYY